MRNPVRAIFNDFVIAHETNGKIAQDDNRRDDYYRQRELIKLNLRSFIELVDFANLNAKQILLLTYFVYHYQPMDYRTFAIKCERQYKLLNDK